VTSGVATAYEALFTQTSRLFFVSGLSPWWTISVVAPAEPEQSIVSSTKILLAQAPMYTLPFFSRRPVKADVSPSQYLFTITWGPPRPLVELHWLHFLLESSTNKFTETYICHYPIHRPVFYRPPFCVSTKTSGPIYR